MTKTIHLVRCMPFFKISERQINTICLGVDSHYRDAAGRKPGDLGFVAPCHKFLMRNTRLKGIVHDITPDNSLPGAPPAGMNQNSFGD